MKSININVMWLIPLGLIVAGAGAFAAYHFSRPDAPAPAEPVTAPPVVEKPAPAEPKPSDALTDAEVDALIAEIEGEAEPAPAFDPEDMEARRKRWESMSVEQRQMLRKAMFAALAKVDGLEEIGDAIRQGKVDPRQFRMDPTAIADRMEFHADTMDQQAMEQEVTRALQEIVDQARTQMK